MMGRSELTASVERASVAKRRRNGISKLLGDVTDGARDAAETLTGGARRLEGHARDAVRHAVDDPPAKDGDRDRREVEELRAALDDLQRKVNRLAKLHSQDAARRERAE